MDIQPLCTTGVSFCDAAALQEHLQALRHRELAMFLSGSAARRFGLEDVLEALSQQNHMTWVQRIPANPTTADLAAVLALLEGKPLDTLIAIGGGSAIDLAKGAMALHRPGTPLDEAGVVQAIRRRQYGSEGRALVAVPTTAGTGSELTAWATIWGADGQEKLSIDAPFLKPGAALIVPELTCTLPAPLTLSTGLDALCHAVEAYWARCTSPLAQSFAHRAVEMILETLPPLMEHLPDLALRREMSAAATLAGLAFSQTRTTACHSISYPLTMGYGIPHGLACAVTLGPVLRRNLGSFPHWEALAALFDRHGGLQAWLDKACGATARLRLSAWGVEGSALDLLAAKAFTKGRMDNNPVAFTQADVLEILRESY